MGNWGRLFQMLVAPPKWITWLAWTNKIRKLNEAILEKSVIAIGETLGGMWSVISSKLGHPARRDWGQGEFAESPHTKRRRCNISIQSTCICVSAYNIIPIALKLNWNLKLLITKKCPCNGAFLIPFRTHITYCFCCWSKFIKVTLL